MRAVFFVFTGARRDAEGQQAMTNHEHDIETLWSDLPAELQEKFLASVREIAALERMWAADAREPKA